MVNQLLFLSVLFSVLGMGISQAQAGDYINQHLPSQLKMDVELRYRLEYKDNYDFSDSREDADAFNLYRTRVSLKYMPIKQASFFVQGQDARVSHLSTGTKSLYRNLWDIRQAYGRYEEEVPLTMIGVDKLSVQVGRQEFAYGAERLLGGFNWSNIAQTFDGGKVGVHVAPLNAQVDIFAGDKTGYKTPNDKDANDIYSTSSKDRLVGYYATSKAIHDTTIENYLFHRSTWKNISFGPNGTGEVDNYTVGVRLKNKLPYNFDYEAEAAGQWGNFNDKRVRAGMAVGIIGYTFDMSWKPRLAFEFDYASGGNPGSKTMNTFDNLYPTNHPHYGYMDLISLQNLNDYRYQLSVKPLKDLKLQADWHWIYLDTPKDSFYAAGRTVTRTASGSSVDVSDYVGNEIDLSADYKLNKYVSVQTGYCHLFAGGYLKDTGVNDDADFYYLQTTISF